MPEEKKPKRGRPKKTQSSITPAMAFSILGEVLNESFNQQDPSDLEVFERYTHVLRSKIQTRAQDFADRMNSGYQLICEELNKENLK